MTFTVRVINIFSFQVKVNQTGGLSLAITDFGLSSQAFQNDPQLAYPLKWMPPEFLDIRRREFSWAGDGMSNFLFGARTSNLTLV